MGRVREAADTETLDQPMTRSVVGIKQQQTETLRPPFGGIDGGEIEARTGK